MGKENKNFNIAHGVTHGDRVRFWNNFNSKLLEQISIIKSSQNLCEIKN